MSWEAFSIGSHILNLTKAFGYPEIRGDPTVLAAWFQINDGQTSFLPLGIEFRKQTKKKQRVFF